MYKNHFSWIISKTLFSFSKLTSTNIKLYSPFSKINKLLFLFHNSIELSTILSLPWFDCKIPKNIRKFFRAQSVRKFCARQLRTCRKVVTNFILCNFPFLDRPSTCFWATLPNFAWSGESIERSPIIYCQVIPKLESMSLLRRTELWIFLRILISGKAKIQFWFLLHSFCSFATFVFCICFFCRNGATNGKKYYRSGVGRWHEWKWSETDATQ